MLKDELCERKGKNLLSRTPPGMGIGVKTWPMRILPVKMCERQGIAAASVVVRAVGARGVLLTRAEMARERKESAFRGVMVTGLRFREVIWSLLMPRECLFRRGRLGKTKKCALT